MVGNEKENNGVFPASLFFDFLVGRWWMGSAFPKRLPVCLIVIKAVRVHQSWNSRTQFLLGGKQISHNPAMRTIFFTSELYWRNSLCKSAPGQKIFTPHIEPSPSYDTSLYPSILRIILIQYSRPEYSLM